MTTQPMRLHTDMSTLQRLPVWVTKARPETPEDMAFLSGAALSHLDLVLARDDVPQAVLRARLALRAAESALQRMGRSERAADLRDAAAFLHPGDHPGPAGEVYLSWGRAAGRRISGGGLHRALPGHAPEQIAEWLDAGTGGPVARAAMVLEAVRSDAPRDETAALVLADAVLARAVGWDPLVPLLARGLTRRDLRGAGDDLRLACHRAVRASAIEAARLAAELARAAACLRAAAPKLRARGAGPAVETFLTRDAVAPTGLTSLRSDRAARRFCDRLVALGAVRELTGRDMFRLYGL